MKETFRLMRLILVRIATKQHEKELVMLVSAFIEK